jgi:ABC-type nitrate/sulfonate/bicarbonate transport system ATPase subunit/phosphosulfolactate synthase (CoM biosynthesis protein A)
MAIKIHKVTKHYPLKNRQKNITALEDVSLEINDKEFICLLGPSGCGKSTLLKILGGLENADSGQIIIDGREVIGPGQDRGMVFQDYGLFPWRTVQGNVEFGLELRKLGRRERQDISSKYLTMVGLKGFEHVYPYQLSGGMKQRVAIARALSLNPKIILMDEPFGALDAFTRMQMQDEITSIWEKEQRTVVFVTHDIDEAVYLADRIAIMTPSPGRIKAVIGIPLPRPRDRASVEFAEIRGRVFAQFEQLVKTTKKELTGNLAPAKNKAGHGWREVLEFPLADRQAKPRDSGLTMVIDTGLCLTETKELLDMAARYIDLYKLGFGTSALYSTKLLEEKISLVRSYGVDIFPGGTFLEVAVMQHKLEEFLELCHYMGYSYIEVSDGTIEMDSATRSSAIKRAKEAGFKVVSEVGKNDPNSPASIAQIIRTIESDLEDGVEKVIIEGRESGQGVIIYDCYGNIIEPVLDSLILGVRDLNTILWEAPLKSQQQHLIARFGSNVNLGNIHHHEVLAVEAMRVGLRSDTLRNVRT